MPTSDRRAPLDDQPVALAIAEDAGVLPESDRRAPFDIVQHLADGYQFVKSGEEWAVTLPDGRIGHGPSPEDAIRNVGATILPDESGKRALHRADGTLIPLDA